MMAASLNKMIGPDYVYILIQNSASAFGTVDSRFYPPRFYPILDFIQRFFGPDKIAL
jgi:hypothetical protein